MRSSLRILRGPRPFVGIGGVGAILLSIFHASLQASDRPAWHVVRGEVRVACPMTVGGGFEARTSSLSGTVTLAAAHPAVLSGELAVDLGQLDTGIVLRNDHLRETYLEVDKNPAYAKAVLSEIQLGDVDADTFQGKTRFSGVFQLHGTQRAIQGQAEIHRAGSAIRVEASFPVTLADYGIAKPQYLGVGVKDEVQVKVTLVAEPAQATLGASR